MITQPEFVAFHDSLCELADSYMINGKVSATAPRTEIMSFTFTPEGGSSLEFRLGPSGILVHADGMAKDFVVAAYPPQYGARDGLAYAITLDTAQKLRNKLNIPLGKDPFFVGDALISTNLLDGVRTAITFRAQTHPMHTDGLPNVDEVAKLYSHVVASTPRGPGQPVDNDLDKDIRLRRAEMALAAGNRTFPSRLKKTEEKFTDLLTGLMHYADREKIDFASALEVAVASHGSEDGKPLNKTSVDRLKARMSNYVESPSTPLPAVPSLAQAKPAIYSSDESLKRGGANR